MSDERDRRDDQHGGAPAEMRRDAREGRQEDKLAGRRGAGEQADDEAAPRREPARRHHGAEHVGDGAGADADHDAPQEHELPGLRMKVVSATPVASSASALTMVRRRPKRSMNEAANGPIDAVEHEAHRDRERDGRARPVEFLSNGTISTPGVERTPAPISRVTKVTPTTIQP